MEHGPSTKFDIMLTPFHSGKKQAHHCRSEWKPLFSLILWWSFLAVVDNVIICLRKVLPGRITQQACCSCPINDNRFLFVLERLEDHFSISSCNLLNFSCGNRKVLADVSNSIPKNTSEVDGPSVLWAAMGTPN